MKRVVYISCLFVLVGILTGHSAPPDEYDSNWPQWRGPAGTGVAAQGNPPIEWSEEKNVRWKCALPGRGQSTPVIWGDRIFILSAVETDKEAPVEPDNGNPESGRSGWRPPLNTTTKLIRFEVLAIDRNDGSIIWQKTSRENKPHQDTHATGSWASNSPVTDGEHVYAYFGSNGLFCYDLNGNLKWQKDLGDMDVKLSFGEGSSPVLHKDKLFINWDHEGQSFVVALNKSDGEEVWRKQRDEQTSWSSPLVVNSNGKDQVIISATSRVRSYDADNGEIIWESSGMTANVIPTPVAGNDIVYIMSGFRGSALQAIRLSAAKGDVRGTNAVVWELDKDTPYTPSALLYDGLLYFLKGNKGILSCYDAANGVQHYGRQRLQGIRDVYASPLAVSGRIYIVDLKGNGVVVKHGKEFELLASNKLDESFAASPVVIGNDLFLRGDRHLYCISE
jgi:outer membrane protein assembly factor BamB